MSTPLDDLSQGGSTATGTASTATGGAASTTTSTGGVVTGGNGGAGGSTGGSAAGGGSRACAANGTSTLEDNFDGTVVGPQWTEYVGSSMAVNETGGAIAIDIGATGMPAFADIRSASAYDLTSCHALIQAVEVPSDITGVYAAFALYVTGGDTNYLEIAKMGPTLYFRYWKDGVVSVVDQHPYSATTDVWWRIREAGGTIYWDTSSDGMTFTPGASLFPAPFPVTALQLSVIAGTDVMLTASPGRARFDDLNLPP